MGEKVYDATTTVSRNPEAYRIGFEDGVCDVIDKACEWLEDNLLSYWQQCATDPEEFIKEFRKAMEE